MYVTITCSERLCPSWKKVLDSELLPIQRVGYVAFGRCTPQQSVANVYSWLDIIIQQHVPRTTVFVYREPSHTRKKNNHTTETCNITSQYRHPSHSKRQCTHVTGTQITSTTTTPSHTRVKQKSRSTTYHFSEVGPTPTQKPPWTCTTSVLTILPMTTTNS